MNWVDAASPVTGPMKFSSFSISIFVKNKRSKPFFNKLLGFLLVLKPRKPQEELVFDTCILYQMAFFSSFRRVLGGSSSASSLLQSHFESIRHSSTLTSPKLFISGTSWISSIGFHKSFKICFIRTLYGLTYCADIWVLVIVMVSLTWFWN